MTERKDKGGILGFGILGGNRPKVLEKMPSARYISKPAPPDDTVRARRQEFCRQLDAAILDEENAQRDYAKLADELYKAEAHSYDVGTTMKAHERILGIRQQEINHKKILEDIKRRYC